MCEGPAPEGIVSEDELAWEVQRPLSTASP